MRSAIQQFGVDIEVELPRNLETKEDLIRCYSNLR